MTAAGSTPQDRQSWARAYCNENSAGWVKRVSLIDVSSSLSSRERVFDGVMLSPGALWPILYGVPLLLLPVWLLTYRFGNKPFQVAVNATTGEVVGERPWSAVKIFFAVVFALILLVIVFTLAEG